MDSKALKFKSSRVKFVPKYRINENNKKRTQDKYTANDNKDLNVTILSHYSSTLSLKIVISFLL